VIVIDDIDSLAAGEINAMTTLTQLVQTDQFPRKFHAVSQCSGRRRRFFLNSGSFAFPLPAAISIERFRVNSFAVSHYIDSHAAWPGCPVLSIHLKVWIYNM
jgi:hypothetical protein